jgi:2,3-bisphosphoglycerate-dependent phosphoglycerate mutase
MPVHLVLLRHGQSESNSRNLFTGWTDVDLTEQGRAEVRHAAVLLRSAGLQFDVAFTSWLRRAEQTLQLVLEGMNLREVPVHRSWLLNERHYGQLQGLEKKATVARHGADQVQRWRRSFDTPPPPVESGDERHPRHDPLYEKLDPALLPASESLQDTLDRVRVCWRESIAPELMAGHNVLVAAHGNSLRSIVNLVDGLTEEETADFGIPTAAPLVYELDADLAPLSRRFLEPSTDADRTRA